MLTARAYGFAIILVIISLIGCIDKSDYNIVIGVGIIYLGLKHHYLHNLSSFYVLIGLSILVDGVSIFLLSQKSIFIRFIITILEIIIKICIIVFMGIQSKKENSSMDLRKQNQNELIPQIQGN